MSLRQKKCISIVFSSGTYSASKDVVKVVGRRFEELQPPVPAAAQAAAFGAAGVAGAAAQVRAGSAVCGASAGVAGLFGLLAARAPACEFRAPGSAVRFTALQLQDLAFGLNAAGLALGRGRVAWAAHLAGGAVGVLDAVYS